jgi:hypothetical protein
MALNVGNIYAVGVGAASSIGQIVSQTIAQGVQHSLFTGSGVIDPRMKGILTKRPLFTFGTQAINTALGLIGIDGLPVTTSAKVKFYIQQMSQGGLKTAGSAHYLITVNEGIVVPKRLSVSQDGVAVIEYDAYAVNAANDGTAPVTRTAASALAGTLVHDEGYTAGAITINGTEINLIQSWELDFGIRVNIISGSGSVYPVFCAIIERNPTLTFRTLDAGVLAVLTEAGISLASGAVAKLRTVTKNASVHATTGLGFTFNAGLGYLTDIGGQHGAEVGYGGMLCPTYDGSNAIIIPATF